MLTYDEIPHERRTICDYTSRLDERNGVLGIALGIWMARDDAKTEPDVRWAANIAMDAMDAMLAELHRLRSRLMTEIRASDDIRNARVDEMLADAKAARA